MGLDIPPPRRSPDRITPRRAIQAATRDKGAKPGKLIDEIKDLGNKVFLRNRLSNGRMMLRKLGNVGAHPDDTEPPINEEDARDIVEFARYFLEFLYTIPFEIAEYRKRREEKRLQNTAT